MAVMQRWLSWGAGGVVSAVRWHWRRKCAPWPTGCLPPPSSSNAPRYILSLSLSLSLSHTHTHTPQLTPRPYSLNTLAERLVEGVHPSGF